MAAVILLALMLNALAGCAGTAKGIDRSVYRQVVPEESVSAPDSTSTALVVIRYPAMIHAEAESLYVSSFAVKGIGGEVPYTAFGKPQTGRIAQSVIAKSSYFAMSLYRELKAELPAGTVLLSPHIILWDDERKLHSRPILASEQIPSVLTVDFNIYSFPDVNQMMDAPPVTFGDLVSPLMVIKSHRWARPALNGLFLASEPLLDSAWRQSGDLAGQQLTARANNERERANASLDFVAFLSERDKPATGLPVVAPGQRAGGRIAVEEYPVEKIQMPANQVAVIEAEGVEDPFVTSFVRGASARIQSLLEEVDKERATFFTRQTALARFDPELASVFFMQSQDEAVRSRLQLAEALVAAEREFLVAQSDSIYDGTFTGDFGIKLRKIIAAEYRMLEERRRLARKQNVTTAVAALALAGSVYGATVTTTASAAAVAAFSGVSLLGSVWALNTALDTRSESQEVTDYFIARMAPTFERQMSVQMEWLESKELITARGFAEFRNKTLTLYQSRVRSLPFDTQQRCVFRHPDFDVRGRWYGECEGGSASGAGYGVIKETGLGAVEYVGDTENGRANGQGAMIVQSGDRQALIYFEGEFSDGLPHGSVRVEQVGNAPQWRQYANGADTGRGEPGELYSFRFSDSMSSAELLNP